MDVVWIVNTIFPDLAKDLGRDVPVFGGWMYGLAKLIAERGIHLSVVTVSKGDLEHECSSGGIDYYLLKSNLKNTQCDIKLSHKWEKLVDKINPDIVHVHGTEFAHGLSLMRTMPNMKYVVSIQGLVGVYERYYTASISYGDILRNITFRDIVRQDSIFQGKRNFERRGKLEREYFQRANGIIGRTDWDLAHTKVNNPSADYYFCNENLRNAFYTSKKWNIQECNKYSIFLSQAGYPIKGLHQVLKAVYLLNKKFPNITVRVGGNNIFTSESFSDRLKLNGYSKYINRLIRKLDLGSIVHFLGPLDEKQMVTEYQKAHLFICPSSIENSPNSLGEAQLIGTPVISSFVGGVGNMIDNGKTGLYYRFDEIEILASYIETIFNDQEMAQNLSKNSIAESENRHNRDENTTQLINIYKSILNERDM